MREYFTYGSVRGAAGNGGPYRDPARGEVICAGDVDLRSSLPKCIGNLQTGRANGWE
jgi:hypothetical protein